MSVNRSVLVVRPRQPYLDWVHSLNEEGKKFTLDDLRNSCTALSRISHHAGGKHSICTTRPVISG
jgi:hypothetical protein